MGCGGGTVGPKIEEENLSGRKVFCVKFQKEMPGLDEVPFDNHPLGQRIYESVSKEAWKLWLEQMKMIMNEYSSRWTITSSARAPRFRRVTSRRAPKIEHQPVLRPRLAYRPCGGCGSPPRFS